MSRLHFIQWFIDADNMEDKDYPVNEQYVENVEDFGSQYGSELTMSNTAPNLCGPTRSSFPIDIDSSQAFIMRTHGTWWDKRRSVLIKLPAQVNGKIQSHDFIEVSYEKAVYPLEVLVFETFNPGTLVRIWALGPTSWALLWEGEPEEIDKPSIFSPPLKQVHFPTRILRLEFNHKLLPYCTEIEAIMLKGKEPTGSVYTLKPNSESPDELFTETSPVSEKDFILKQTVASNLCTKFTEPSTSKFIDANVVEGPPLEDHFHRLSEEMILSVFKHLDVQTLARCAQVNKRFCGLASDASLYKCVDLRPYWHCVRSEVLETLSTKCRFLETLDLSWCGSHSMIESDYVVSFLQKCGARLKKLRLNCCKFVNDSVLEAIASYAPNLEELSLRSVKGCSGWSVLKDLKKLVMFDMYSTNIPTKDAVDIAMSNPRLQHVNLGDCKMITAMDEVAHALAVNCPDLTTVDFWKSHSLTASGVKCFSRCKRIIEVDFGWWSVSRERPRDIHSLSMIFEPVKVNDGRRNNRSR